MTFKHIFILTSLLLGACRGPQIVTDNGPEAVFERTKQTEEARQKQAPAKPERAAPEEPSERLMTLDHKYFVVVYNPAYRMAKYVRYTMTAEQLRQHRAKRADKFHPDQQLSPKLQAIPKEYARTGYDRGHLAPAADFGFSQEANDATFVMSNMAPQSPGLNRNAWKDLEEQVRRWACGEEKVTVITGPIFTDRMPALESGLPVPPEFFKIVIDETPPRKVLAFIYRQEDKGKLVKQRTVPVQNVLEKIHEKFAGDLNDEPVRAPSQIAAWKEDEC